MRRTRYDLVLLLLTIVLVAIGITMVYSASAVLALERFGDSYFFLKRQLLWALLGLVGLGGAMYFDHQKLRRCIYPLLGLSILLLLLVLVSPWGKEIEGARRWLRMGGITFQPSELAKLVLVIYLAHSLTKRQAALSSFTRGYLPHLLVIGLLALLIFLQPDLGTAVILVMVAFTLLFVGGVPWTFLSVSVLALLPWLYQAITSADYRQRRILAFQDPWSDPTDAGFQIIQSLFALGRGGIWGLGLGAGKQKLFFLPAPHTDFILAVLGEELGFIGTAGLLVGFLLVLWRGMAIALRAKDPFSMQLAFGIVFLLLSQVIINSGVVVGLLPTKGLPLPLISLGGSSLVTNMVGIGILLNISSQSSPPSSLRRRP
ncbi:MAG: putative lipid II flippase FtsW [Nitrospinota bacterium]|nr:MAG: putative lipid II flippase FtsW [Nitrospinota bacterium]